MAASWPVLALSPRANFRLPELPATGGVLDAQDRRHALTVVEALCSAPTAPYHEDAELALVREFVRSRPGFELVIDEHENMIVRWPGSARRGRSSVRELAARPALAFSAHLDHPGFEYVGRKRGRELATFHGGVGARYFPGAAVRFFEAGTRTACMTATVVSVEPCCGADHLAVLEDVRGTARAGAFGVFDLTDGVLRGTRLHARVCDDLMGAAAILCMLDRLARDRFERPVLGIFTRAEETGFVGCLGLMRSQALPRGTAVVGLECSPQRITARVGQGPVVRVGDRHSVFSPRITHHLQECAARLAERHPGFLVQRALMDGGACESTPYNLHGLEAGALCLALGNYHNCGPRGRIAPEYVDWNDFEGLVALMLEAARTFGVDDAEAKMRARLQRIWKREYKRLGRSARRIAAARDCETISES